MLEKKSPWLHYNTRYIKLFSYRIEYWDPRLLELKGTIHLDKDCKAIQIDEIKFNLVTKTRTYLFKVFITIKLSA